MIVQKNFLSKLRDFGLNSYESKLWTALLARGVSTAGELSDIAGVPRSRTYDVLESLEKKGFIIMKVGKPIKYLAFPPQEVIERVKKKIQEEAETRSLLLEELKSSTVIDELNSLHTQGAELVEAVDMIGSLKGRKTIYNQMETLINQAKQSVVLMSTVEGLTQKKDALYKALAKAAERKVDIKIAAPITKENIGVAKDLAKLAEVRHTDIASRFCLIDGNRIVFALVDDADPSYEVAVWAETKPFLSAIKTFFDSNWKGMKPLGQLKA